MKLPFTTEDFFKVIENYNQSVFPIQVIFLIAGIYATVVLFRNPSGAGKTIGLILSALWLWMGIFYHLNFFTQINPAAYGFGILFIIEGLLIFRSSFIQRRIIFSSNTGWIRYLGYFFILYGLTIYPIISYFTESSVVQTISLGLPCPSTILTFGFFILAAYKIPRHLLLIPFIWAVIGISAALNIGIYQDLMIIVAAIAAILTVFLLAKSERVITGKEAIFKQNN